MTRTLSLAALLTFVSVPAMATGGGGGPTCEIEGLGEAGEYNALAFSTFDASSSEIDGRLAAGRVYLRSYKVGGKLPYTSGSTISAWSYARLQNGSSHHGDVDVWGACNDYSWTFADGTRNCSNTDTFNAASLRVELRNLSNWLHLQPATSPTTYHGSGVVTLNGDDDVNVFDLSPHAAGGARVVTLNIDAPAGSTVIVNLAPYYSSGGYYGSRFFHNMGFNLEYEGLHYGDMGYTGVTPETILYNMPTGGSTYYMRGVGIKGSVLAPYSQVNLNSGHIEGTLISDRFYGTGEFHLAPFTGETCPPPGPPPCPYDEDDNALGPAGDYNVYIFENFDGDNSDIQGRTAVGGDAWFEHYGLASSHVGGGNVLEVVGDASLKSVQIYNGDGEVGGTCTTSELGTPEGDLTCLLGSSVYDTTDEQSNLGDLSEYLGDLDDSDGSDIDITNWGVVTLESGTDDLQVFNLNLTKMVGDMLFASDVRTLNIEASATQTVVVNVTGDTSRFMDSMGFHLSGGITTHNIVFNYPSATSLSIYGVTAPGSVLAPFADVAFDNGNIDGTLIAKSVSGYGEFHTSEFGGSFCPVLSSEEEEERKEKEDDDSSSDDDDKSRSDKSDDDDSGDPRVR